MNIPRTFRVTAGALFSAAALAFLSGCATEANQPLHTARVDLHRYGGKWYEVARIQNHFQHRGEHAMVVFVPTTATQATVRVSAIEPSGKTRTFRGTAEVVPGSDGGRLRVKFHGLAELAPASDQGNYWIIGLDDRYLTTMVATPDRQYLWILSRDPHLPLGATKAYLTLAAKEGFQMKHLVWDYSEAPAQ
ncbi:Lipocalin family protein [Chthoniobacter flavus Ellin428]|uniref:Lipocalin family protein n=1 Tax=Chthoniobacter flavus Ellin428 TaxID=497964 RepID=B4CUV3_9BACT|nr:lipocalin family protein [Chthoniobacter flavus]EDY22341.1 Lipocalin family protein [Chthoniobacter flavus Ellin428]TCO94645.1 apolipoprotein D and lipocalin family protein [Chthoniobacter flavus]